MEAIPQQRPTPYAELHAVLRELVTSVQGAWRSDLVDRAWDGRPNLAVAVRKPANPADFDRTLRFVRFIIDESEQIGHDDARRGRGA
jgi:hypothetical protein